MSDEDDQAIVLIMPLHRCVNFFHQWTGCIQGDQMPRFRFLMHGDRDSVGAENSHGFFRNLLQLLHKPGAFFLEARHHGLIVHDFMPHVNRCPEFLKGFFHDADGAIHAGAESTRGSQINLHGQ